MNRILKNMVRTIEGELQPREKARIEHSIERGFRIENARKRLKNKGILNPTIRELATEIRAGKK